jgi:class 3 adenylate cyclase
MVAVGARLERVRESMSGLVERARRVFQRCGGTVNKFTGDGIMGQIGATQPESPAPLWNSRGYPDNAWANVALAVA